MPCHRVGRVVLLTCLSPLLLATARAAEEPVARGPAHAPTPYRYERGLLKQVPRAFLDNGPACVLYDCCADLLQPDGSDEEVYHQVIRLNNRKGVEALGEFHQIVFDPSYQKLTLNRACVHKAGGGSVAVRPQDLQLRDSNIDYLDCHRQRELLISFPGLAGGDVIEVEWTLRGKDPEGQGQFFNRFIFGTDEYPTVRSECFIRLGRDRVLRYATTGGDVKHEERDEGGTRLHVWRANLRPPLPAEDRLPRKEDLRLQLWWSTFASWEDVGQWYRHVRKGCWECTPDMRRAVCEATRGAASAADKARALAAWVRRNVRYLSLHERDSFAPHTPARVLANRYGDCKDQSQLLAVLLKAAGIPAGVAVLGWPDDGQVLEAVPSPMGTHAIVLATVDGHDHWIDPVVSDGRWDLLAADDYGRLTFVADGTGPVRLVRTPALTPEDNRTEVSVELKVRADGSAHGEATWAHYGVAAANARRTWMGLTASGRRQFVRQEVQRIDDSVRLERVTADEESLRDVDGPMRLRASFELTGLFDSAAVLAHDTKVWDELLHDKPAPDRRLPVLLGEPRGLRQTWVVELPAAYHWDDLGVPEKASARSAGCSYTRRIRRDRSRPQRLTVDFRARLEKPRVEPADLAAFRTFIKEATDLSSLWLSTGPVTKLEEAAAVEAALKANPHDTASALVLAQLYRSNSKPDEARRVLERASKENPGEDKLLEMLLLVADELKERSATDKARAQVQLARNAFDRGDMANASQHFEEASHTSSAVVQTAEALEFRGRLSEARGERKDAAAAYEAWLKLQPANAKAQEGMVRLALAAGERREAVDWWRRYTVAVGSDAAGLVTAADFALRLERYDDALDLAWRSRKGQSGAAAQRISGLVYLHRGKYRRAAKNLAAALEAAPRRSPPDGQVLQALIRARLALGQLSQAVTSAARAARVAGPSPELRRLCTLVRTLDVRRTSLEKECPAPPAQAALWSQLVGSYVCAEQLKADGRPAGEIDGLLTATLAGGVDFGPAYALRAQQALECGRLSQALADAEKAVALSPKEARGWLVRGRVRLERAAPGALADLEKAAKLSGGRDADVLRWLAVALAQANGNGRKASSH
jgi:tetratricopeptide (TPR) repeat protein